MRAKWVDSPFQLGFWKTTQAIALLLITGGWSNAVGRSPAFELSCWDGPCREPVIVEFIDVRAGEQIGRAVIQPGSEAEVPLVLLETLNDDRVSSHDIEVTVAGDEFVSTRPRLDEILDSRVALKIWKAAVVNFDIRSVDRRRHTVPPSGEAKVLFWPADGSGAIDPIYESNCQMQQAGLTCRAPQGSWDIRLDLPGFVSIEKWAESITSAEVRELGVVRLERGADVNGVLLVEGADPPDFPEEAIIEIVPTDIIRYENPSEKLRHLRVLRRTAIPDLDGSFRFEDLPVGSFIVRAVVAGVGESELRKVSVDGPTKLNLTRPLVVSKRIEPVLRTGFGVDPNGQPLLADLQSVSDKFHANGTVLRFSLDQSGLTSMPPVVPGQYVLVIQGVDDVVYFRDIVAIDRDTESIDIEMQHVPVIGTVVMDDDPLIGAHLEFSGHGGEQIPATTDENGRFTVVLPAEGRWFVSIVADRPPLPYGFAEVDVLAGSPVAIEIERTGIRVFVKDATLAPVSSARVVVICAHPYNLSTRTDEDGMVELVGLPQREYLVQAYSEELQSLLRIIKLERVGIVESDLQLQHSSLVVRGRLIDRDGRPVAHAEGAVFARDPGGDPVTLSPPDFSTDSEGQFIVHLPSNAAFYHVVVAVEGFEIFLSDEMLVTGGMTDAPVLALSESSGGIVEVELPRFDPHLPYTVLMINRTAVPTGWVRGWSRTVDGPPGEEGTILFLAHDMPSGDYALCRGDMLNFLRAISGSSDAEMECVEGYLAEGGRLRLEGLE